MKLLALASRSVVWKEADRHRERPHYIAFMTRNFFMVLMMPHYWIMSVVLPQISARLVQPRETMKIFGQLRGFSGLDMK
jgi:hypothetical protein